MTLYEALLWLQKAGRTKHAAISGMRVTYSWRGHPKRHRLGGPDLWGDVHDVVFDLSDPATVGCLAALAREATGEPTLHARYQGQGEWVVESGVRLSPYHRTAGWGWGEGEGEAWQDAITREAQRGKANEDG